MKRRWSNLMVVGVIAGLVIGLHSPAHAQRTMADVRNSVNDGMRDVLERPVTLQLDSVSLRRAILAVAQAAHVQLVFQAQIVDGVAGRFTVNAKAIPLGDVLDRMLSGTQLRAVSLGRDLVSIEPGPRAQRMLDGIITGVVVDAATKRPVSGATVVVDKTKYTTRTADDGTFRIVGVPAGLQRVTVRRLGYQIFGTMIEVKDDESASITVQLLTAATRLTEVVTTAAGNQRRLEVGHVIAHLNIDSIAPTAPVTSLTDLLSARAPGVQVVESNGLVGSGPAIRIRGQNSLVLAGDPIIVVDGVRQDNRAGGTVLFTVTPSPSRLNDLDFSQIETIDILKGPAASTEYGTDAANGVIVITTKRGKAGATQWRASGERGWSDVPTGFPDYYYGWGHLKSSGAATQCTLAPRSDGRPSVTDSTCIIDSTTAFNPLNHKDYSLYGTGLRERADLEVSGGSNTVRYYIGGGTSRDIGTTKLPTVFRSQAIALGFPTSIFNPNTQQQRSGRINLVAQLGQTADLTANGAYLATDQQTLGAITFAIGTIFGPSLPDSAHNYGYGTSTRRSPLATLGSTGGEAVKRATAGLTADWRPATWLSGRATLGLDHGSQQTHALRLPQSVAVANGSVDAGELQVTNATNDVYSVDTRGSITSWIRHVRAMTAFGLQIANTRSQGVTADATNIAQANITLNGAPSVSVTQAGDGHATVGGYLEEQLGVADRLFVTGAVRIDGASGFGGDYHATAYPKLSASWLAMSAGTTTIRLRAAYGAAGVQPYNGATFQLYYPTTVYVDGAVVSANGTSAPGNPDLRPERSQEFEGGIDVGLWGDRVNLELTHYTKHTKDALVNTTLGFDVNEAMFQENLGDVRNTGLEGTLQLSPIRTTSVTWNVTLNASHNTNKLLRIARGVTAHYADLFAGYQRHIAGFPLYGYWGQRVTFEDANHDGMISQDEVTIADSTTYLGSSIPRLETSASTQLGLFHGALTIGSLFDYRGGGLIRNGLAFNAAGRGVLREQADPTAPLWLQARAVASGMDVSNNSLLFEDVSFLRWRELSMTYAVPLRLAHRARIQSFSVTAAVRNVGTLWSRYTGADPETSDPGGGSYFYDAFSSTFSANNDLRNDSGGSVPLSRTWLIRINAGF